VKSKLRENRIPKGSRAKADRIVKDLRSNPPARYAELPNASGAKLFAIWKEQQGRARY
jgi:hypothetical protein